MIKRLLHILQGGCKFNRLHLEFIDPAISVLSARCSCGKKTLLDEGVARDKFLFKDPIKGWWII